MLVHLYVAEKLIELHEERLGRVLLVEQSSLKVPKPPLVGRAAAVTGRSLRRAGEALELWATPASERELRDWEA